MGSAFQSASGLKVLVVEDEALIALDIRDMLTGMGCMVIGPAPTVARALRLLDQSEPEFAILDVNLGRERATPIAEALRERGVPFALATAYGRSQLPEKALRQAPLLGKPIDPRLLQNALADLRKGASDTETRSPSRDQSSAASAGIAGRCCDRPPEPILAGARLGLRREGDGRFGERLLCPANKGRVFKPA